VGLAIFMMGYVEVAAITDGNLHFYRAAIF
jgi:hypothetical protein